MFLSRNKNNVYPCKPQFYHIYCIKVGFKGGQNYIGIFSWCALFTRIPFIRSANSSMLPLNHMKSHVQVSYKKNLWYIPSYWLVALVVLILKATGSSYRRCCINRDSVGHSRIVTLHDHAHIVNFTTNPAQFQRRSLLLVIKCYNQLINTRIYFTQVDNIIHK